MQRKDKYKIVDALRGKKSELTTTASSDRDLATCSLQIKIMVHYNANGSDYCIAPEAFRENYNGNMYAKDDYLDQPLVKLAQKFGYDTIILEREVGEYNIITEVIDCRIENNYNPDTKFPLIWTQSKGFIKLI